MKKKKLSISDVARATGVSVTTVSFVLNNKGEGRISPGVIRKIKDYARKVGYQPNPLVRKRKGDKSKIFGVLVEDIANPVQSELVFQLEQLWRQSSHHSVVMSMNRDLAVGEELLRVLLEKEMDGYVLMDFKNIERSLRKLMESDVPVVLYDCQAAEESVPSVNTDYSAAVMDAVSKHFQMSGESRLGLVACSSNPYRTREFLDGYMKVMDVYSYDVLIKKVQSALPDVEVEDQIGDFIQDNRLDAVLFSTDLCARIGKRVITKKLLSVRTVICTATFPTSVEEHITYRAVTQNINLSAEKIAEMLLSQYERK